jgi:DNA-binding response OmpR family regulator/HPt (histidine-containing phosphotransfer) domain-containing protein
MRILIVEDDDVLRALLTQRLSEQHYAIDTATDGLLGWEYASTYEYDLLVLDVVLPKLDGLALCKKLRHGGYTLPILILTAQDTSTAKMLGLDAGADDYVVKPFDEAELIARIRALLRRSCSNPLPILTWGDLWLNSNTHEVSYAGDILELTAKEYSLLEMMMRESQHVFSKEEILESLWSAEEFPVEATVRSHMRRLRNKLTAIGAPADLISTAHGQGYYLKPPSSDPESEPLTSAEDNSPGSPDSSLLDAMQKQTQYLELLNQTWQNHRSRFLDRVQEVRAAIENLQHNCLTVQAQTEAYRVVHTFVGTLGTFGLQQAMIISRNLEQELHPDIYPEPSQAPYLQTLLSDLQAQIEHTESLPTLPTLPTISSRSSEPGQVSGSISGRSNLVRSPSEIRVLWVDDDPLFLQASSKQLQGYGFQVSILDDPQQFWPVLEGVHPDVLILDLQMPQVNGLELCQMLRSKPHWQKIPVMFLSMFADSKTQHDAFSVGADDYLCKPITTQDLSDRIHHRLQRIQVFSQ